MAYWGMRGTGNWGTDERPKSWRQGILYLYPNGDMPLTAITSKMPTEAVDDPEHTWWTKILPSQEATVTGVYSDQILATPYAGGGAIGSTIYFKMASAGVQHFRAGHQVLMESTGDYTLATVGKCTAAVDNGASSYIAIKLLEADDNGVGNLSTCNVVYVSGNINPEGGAIPDAIAYDPVKVKNFTQIFRNSLLITETARQTKLRTTDAYQEAKREALEMHGTELEKAFLWGIPTEGTGANGKPERTLGGIIWFIKTYAMTTSTIPADHDHIVNYPSETVPEYLHKTWIAAGEQWFDEHLEIAFRYGSKKKLAVAGSGALLGIERLAKSSGQFTYTATTRSYGIQVTEWVTPFGTIDIVTHPLFSYRAAHRYRMILMEPKNLRYRPLKGRDTHFKADDSAKKGGQVALDATSEEFLTECTLEMHHPWTFMMFEGVGKDNP